MILLRRSSLAGGQQRTAACPHDQDADINWIPDWEELRPLDSAIRSCATDLAAWLRDHHATTAAESAH
jgi:hypothetical protein